MKKFISTAIFIFLISVNFYAQKAGMNVVKTTVPANYMARIVVGDSIIVYGTGAFKGVDYIKVGDTKGRGIPGAENFSFSSFAVVSGDRIILTKPDDFSLHLFDTKTGKMSQIPGINLRAIGGSMMYGGAMQADGNYLIALTKAANGDQISIIDFSGNAPVVTNYKNWKTGNYLTQVAIDADSGWAAVQGSEQFAAFMFKSGDGEPLLHSFKDKGNVSTDQMKIDGDTLYYFDAKSGSKNLLQMNLRSGEIKTVGTFPANLNVAANGGTVAYFANRDAKDQNGTEARLAVMKKGGQPVIVAPTDKFIDGSTKNSGIIGFGNMAAVTPDGKKVFISGNAAIGYTERLQMYDGTSIKTFPDSSAKPAFLQASDVVANDSIVAFKTGTNNTTMIGYIKLK